MGIYSLMKFSLIYKSSGICEGHCFNPIWKVKYPVQFKDKERNKMSGGRGGNGQEA